MPHSDEETPARAGPPGPEELQRIRQKLDRRNMDCCVSEFHRKLDQVRIDICNRSNCGIKRSPSKDKMMWRRKNEEDSQDEEEEEKEGEEEGEEDEGEEEEGEEGVMQDGQDEHSHVYVGAKVKITGLQKDKIVRHTDEHGISFNDVLPMKKLNDKTVVVEAFDEVSETWQVRVISDGPEVGEVRSLPVGNLIPRSTSATSASGSSDSNVVTRKPSKDGVTRIPSKESVRRLPSKERRPSKGENEVTRIPSKERRPSKESVDEVFRRRKSQDDGSCPVFENVKSLSDTKLKHDKEKKADASAASRTVRVRFAMPVSHPSCVNTRDSVCSVTLGRRGDFIIFKTFNKTLRPFQLFYVLWWIGGLSGLGGALNIIPIWNAGFAVLLIPAPTIVILMCSMSVLRELALSFEMWYVMVLQALKTICDIALLNGPGVLFCICYAPTLCTVPILDAYPNKMRFQVANMFFFGNVVILLIWLFALLYPWDADGLFYHADAAFQLGRGHFRLRALSISLTTFLLIFSLRYLISINIIDRDTFVVVKSPMITAIEKHTIAARLVKVETALSQRRKRYPNYHTTGARKTENYNLAASLAGATDRTKWAGLAGAAGEF